MILRILVYTLILFAAVFIRIKILEANAVFYPDKGVIATPALFNLSFEDIYIETEDNIKLNGWFIPAQEAEYTLLLFHGNAGNIADRLDKISIFNGLGLNVFIIDYRGYGKSDGRPTESGIYLDAEAAYDYLVNKRKIKDEEIILYGESLGTAVAIDLASKVKVGALILEGTFSSGKDVAKNIYPYLPAILFSNGFDSFSKIGKIDIPKLFIHSKDDEVIPLSLAKKIYEAAAPKKQFVEIKGSHNASFFDCRKEFISAIKSFIEGL